MHDPEKTQDRRRYEHASYSGHLEGKVERNEEIMPEEIHGYLCLPENRDIILQKRAWRAFYRHVNPYIEVDAPEPESNLLTEELFETLYDPNEETIVIDLSHSMRTSEVLALQVQRRRQAGKPTPNILYIRSGTDCGEFRLSPEGDAAFVVTHGILVDANGYGFAGKLPREVVADLVETCNLAFVEQCEKLGIPTFATAETISTASSKENVETIATSSQVGYPERISYEAFSEISRKREQLPESIVVKPSVGAGGRGVEIAHSRGDLTEASVHYELLDRYGYEPIIEWFIPSYPLNDPETNETLDWNTRLIIAGNELIGAYIRADETGKVVNLSRGAKHIALDELENFTDHETARKLQGIIIEAGVAIAKNTPAQFAGGDLIISKDFKPHLLEVNIGQVGLSLPPNEDTETKLSYANSVLDAWTDALWNVTKPATNYTISTSENVGYDVTALFKGLYEIKQVELLSYIPEAEINKLNPTPFERYLWLSSGYYRKEVASDIDTRLIEGAPLEFARNMLALTNLHSNPQGLLRSCVALCYALPSSDPIQQVWKKFVETISFDTFLD